MTKQEQIEDLQEEVTDLRNSLNIKNDKLEKFEEKEREEMYQIRNDENEKTNTIILLREIITLLIAPSIIRDREKQNNERTKL